jgi:hypothetical protein
LEFGSSGAYHVHNNDIIYLCSINQTQKTLSIQNEDRHRFISFSRLYFLLFGFCAQGDDPSAVVDRLFNDPSVVKCLSICKDIDNVDARAECRDSCFETDDDNATGPTSEPKFEAVAPRIGNDPSSVVSCVFGK